MSPFGSMSASTAAAASARTSRVGRRPTCDNCAPLLDFFLFDFSGDLYGQKLQVMLAARLRAEERFDSIEALIAQMDRDSAEARAVLASLAPLGAIDLAVNGPPR